MRLEIRLVLPADARLLSSTRLAMLAHLEALGAEPECCEDVILALDEACANVVHHAFPGRLSARYSLSAVLTPDEADIVVEDRGRGIDRETVRNACHPVEPGATSGRGLYLMRHLMSSVEIEAADPGSGGGTRVRMRKRLRPEAAARGQVMGGRTDRRLAGARPPERLFRDSMF